MRLLIDSCAWRGMITDLAAAGHDVLHVADIWSDDPGDLSILEFAHLQERIVVTRDKDFGELAVAQGLPHSGIIRLWDTPAKLQANVVLSVLAQCKSELAASAIVTASPYRVRIRTNG